MQKTNVTETRDAALLIKPKLKNNSNFPKLYPFPIVRNSSDENVAWNCMIGHLKDHCVEVTDEENMELLFTMGFFGKGTLSRSTPKVLEKKLREQYGANKKNKGKRKQALQEKSENSADKALVCNISDVKDENSAKRRKKDEIEVVLSDTNDDDDDMTDEEGDSSSDNVVETSSKDSEKEALQLSLEEAYFLSYGLGVLIIKDKDQPLDLMNLWPKFCDRHPSQNFPVMYAAYHHFRSKGWIVRSGTKYGADFALYKDGPPFYHSSYVVIVKHVKEQNFRNVSLAGRPNLTWSSLAGLNRMCTHVSKAVIILYVIKPAGISDNKISTPYCVSQYRLEEVLVHRWVPSADRAEDICIL